MTDYWKLTVPQLRAACKARGLPAWQHKGRRLRKMDLVGQLEWNDGLSVVRESARYLDARRDDRIDTRPVVVPMVQGRDTARGCYSVEPAPIRRRSSVRIPARPRTDDDRLIRQLAAMPATPAEAMAIYRMLAGTATPGHNEILRRREARACQRLADRAKTERSRQRWHERYLRATGQALC